MFQADFARAFGAADQVVLASVFRSTLPESERLSESRLVADLREALRTKDQLFVRWHPVVRVPDQRLLGFEALVRWQHPTRGLVSPNEFIPTAEASGLIVPIGAWVLGEACAQLARWHDAGLPPTSMAVNLSARQFEHGDLLATVRAALTTSGVDPAVLAYVVSLARATRESASLSLGVSPRGSAMLLHASKAWAWLSGREFVTPDEVKAIAKPALRHRVQLRPEVELEGVTVDSVLDGVLATVPVPR